MVLVDLLTSAKLPGNRPNFKLKHRKHEESSKKAINATYGPLDDRLLECGQHLMSSKRGLWNGKYPFLVVIDDQNDDVENRRCMGAIYGQRRVVTSSSCIRWLDTTNKQLELHYGHADLDGPHAVKHAVRVVDIKSAPGQPSLQVLILDEADRGIEYSLDGRNNANGVCLAGERVDIRSKERFLAVYFDHDQLMEVELTLVACPSGLPGVCAKKLFVVHNHHDDDYDEHYHDDYDLDGDHSDSHRHYRYDHHEGGQNGPRRRGHRYDSHDDYEDDDADDDTHHHYQHHRHHSDRHHYEHDDYRHHPRHEDGHHHHQYQHHHHDEEPSNGSEIDAEHEHLREHHHHYNPHDQDLYLPDGTPLVYEFEDRWQLVGVHAIKSTNDKKLRVRFGHNVFYFVAIERAIEI